MRIDLERFAQLEEKSQSLAAGLSKIMGEIEKEAVKIALAMKPGDILALKIGFGSRDKDNIDKKTIFLVLGENDSVLIDGG